MRWLVVGLLFGTACAASPPQTTNPMDVVVESWESVDVTQLNLEIDEGVAAGATWPTSPLRMTVELLGGDVDTRSLALTVQKNQGEGADTTVVVMVRDGFLNDSVRGDWHRIVYRRLPDWTWRVHEVRRAFRCWRGHHLHTFSSRWCL